MPAGLRCFCDAALFGTNNVMATRITGPVKTPPPESIVNANPVKHYPYVLTCGSLKCRWLAPQSLALPLQASGYVTASFTPHHRRYFPVYRKGTPPPSPSVFHLRLTIPPTSHMYVNTIASSTSANGNTFVVISLLSYVPHVPSDSAYSYIGLSSSV